MAKEGWPTRETIRGNRTKYKKNHRQKTVEEFPSKTCTDQTGGTSTGTFRSPSTSQAKFNRKKTSFGREERVKKVLIKKKARKEVLRATVEKGGNCQSPPPKPGS